MNIWTALNIAAHEAIKRSTSGRPDGRSFFLGAVGIRKDGVLVKARNEAAEGVTPRVHAEHRLIQKLDFGSKEVFVARVTKGTKEWGMAKPCPRCQAALYGHGIKRAYFTVAPGEYGCLNLDTLEIAWKVKR